MNINKGGIVMKAANNVTFITVSQKSTHVGIGLNIDGVDEYQRFDILTTPLFFPVVKSCLLSV